MSFGINPRHDGDGFFNRENVRVWDFNPIALAVQFQGVAEFPGDSLRRASNRSIVLVLGVVWDGIPFNLIKREVEDERCVSLIGCIGEGGSEHQQG